MHIFNYISIYETIYQAGFWIVLKSDLRPRPLSKIVGQYLEIPAEYVFGGPTADPLFIPNQLDGKFNLQDMLTTNGK